MAETNPLEIIRQQKQNCDTALNAARTEKECLEETKKAIFEAAKEHAQAYIPEEEEKRFLTNIKQTSCAPPTSAQMIPVLKESFKEVGPEITYKRVIDGKKWFWIGIIALVISGLYWYSNYKASKNFDGTAESWAHRMYVAKKELSENNPGAGYDEIMMDFANGFPEKAKDAVTAKEKRVLELQNKRNKYERKISEFLFEDYASGIKILEIETSLEYKYEKKFFGFEIETMSPQKIYYEYFFARAIPNDEQTELRIVMERPNKLPGFKEKWDIYITTDKRINSISDYLQKARRIDWLYAKKSAID